MKLFFPIVLSLVAGIVLGSWQPRGELLTLRKEADALRVQAKKPCRAGGASTLSGIFRVPEDGDAPRPERVPSSATPDDAPPPPPADAAPTGPAGARTEDAMAAMKATLDARRAQALQALTEQGDLTDAQVGEVDRIMDQMNADLKKAVDAMVDETLAAGEMDRRGMLEFGADALDIVLAADDQMRSTLPKEVFDNVDDQTVDPFSYVSGEALESAAKLEGMPGFEP